MKSNKHLLWSIIWAIIIFWIIVLITGLISCTTTIPTYRRIAVIHHNTNNKIINNIQYIDELNEHNWLIGRTTHCSIYLDDTSVVTDTIHIWKY